MKTLEELRNKITALPGLFAGEANGDDAIYPQTLDDSDDSDSGETTKNLSYEDGFTIAYAQDPKTQDGRYLQRNEINRIGEIASRELHFREAGGVHTFSQDVSDSFNGYPANVVLKSYDGECLRAVESTETQNTKPFADDNGIEIPDVIDCPVVKPEEKGTSATPRVLWRSAGWIYGIDESLFKMELDYTHIQQLNEGDPIAKDSLVVGTRHGWWGGAVLGSSVIDRGPMTSKIQIADASGATFEGTFSNKGEFGMLYDYLPFPMCREDKGKFIFYIVMLPVFGRTSGTGNFELHFFGKAGSVFSASLATKISNIPSDSGSITKEVSCGKVDWFAIPIIPRVVEDSDA